MKKIYFVFLIFIYGCSSGINYNNIPTTQELSSYQKYINANAPSDEALRVLELLCGYYHSRKEFKNEINTYNNYKILFETRNQNFHDISQLIYNRNFRYNVSELDLSTDAFKIVPKEEQSSEGARLFLDPQNVDSMFSADNSILLYASDGPYVTGKLKPLNYKDERGFWGNTDIFIKLKLKDSTWSDPINLGTNINTEYAERAPFLSKDKKYLFFSSNRPGGFGGFDLYVCKRLAKKTWNEWSEPINLGRYINTANDEFNYRAETNRIFTFLSNYKLNNKKLFYAYKATAIPIVFFNLKVTDTTDTPLHTRISWTEADTNSIDPEKGINYTDEISGQVQLEFSANKKYNILFEKDGYMCLNKTYDFTNINDTTYLNENVLLRKLIKIPRIKRDTIFIKNIDTIKYFDSQLAANKKIGKADISIDSTQNLNNEIESDEYKFIKWNILSNNIDFIVQISAWKDKIRAENLAQKIKNKGYNIIVKKVYLERYKSIFYRVQIDDKFSTLKDAENFTKKNYKKLYSGYNLNKNYSK